MSENTPSQIYYFPDIDTIGQDVKSIAESMCQNLENFFNLYREPCNYFSLHTFMYVLCVFQSGQMFIKNHNAMSPPKRDEKHKEIWNHFNITKSCLCER